MNKWLGDIARDFDLRIFSIIYDISDFEIIYKQQGGLSASPPAD